MKKQKAALFSDSFVWVCRACLQTWWYKSTTEVGRNHPLAEAKGSPREVKPEKNGMQNPDLRHTNILSLQATDVYLEMPEESGCAFKDLVRCGIDNRRSEKCANTRKDYRHMLDSAIVSRRLKNDNLRPANRTA